MPQDISYAPNIGRDASCIVNLADDYFRHAMFKDPGSDLWAWAFEWDDRLLVFCLFGEAVSRDAFVAGMPIVEAVSLRGDTMNGSVFREHPAY